MAEEPTGAVRDEILVPQETVADVVDEVTDDDPGLRPRTLDEFVGQAEIKEHLSIVLEAARPNGASPPTTCCSPARPGLGKTTLAGIVAHEMGVGLQITSGPALERAGDLAAILTRLEAGDVLFIDEIHRLPRAVEEVLYPAMEDFQLDIVLGKGPAARSIRLELPPLHPGRGHHPHRPHHRPACGTASASWPASSSTTRRTSSRSWCAPPGSSASRSTSRGSAEIAGRARGTPRIANRLLRRVRDFAEVRAGGRIDLEAAGDGLAAFGVDERGLDKVDRSILSALCQSFGGGPVGLKTLAIAVSEPSETVEDVYEPFLIQQGLLMRTPRGRVATPAAWSHLGLAPPSAPPGAASLFE